MTHWMDRRLGWGACLVVLCLLSGCAGWVAQQAEREMADGQSEQALRTLEEGVKKHPDSAELRSRLLTTREQLLQRWLAEAETARAAKRLDEAQRWLTRALTLAPDHTRAREMERALSIARLQSRALEEARGLVQRGQELAASQVLEEALRSAPTQPELLALRRQLEVQQRERQLRVVQAGLAERRPVSLDFRDAGLRQVLDLLSRHSGLNFVLDKDIRNDLRITVFLKQVTVDDALDLLVSTHQLARKVLDSRTVLIYPNTPEKQREYQEQVIRVFYLASAEAKGAAGFLKSMLKMRDPFVDERSNMLAIRESPDTVALASRLVQLYDAQEPEVLLELEVLEVRSTRLTELGVKLPSTLALTPLADATGQLTVANLRGLGSDRIGVAVGGLTLNLRREVGDFEVLANPKVRARNREKAKVLIGDKVPIITTTTSQSGFVGDSVSYLDVGLKLEIEPTVYVNDEVAIRLALEVGSLASQIKTASGTVAYQISTRNASTALRLRDGETQLLAGLLSREERSSASRVPLAGDVPVLGRLFSSQLDDGSRTELVLAITPRIVRNVRWPDAAEAELWVGTEAYTRLRPAGGMAAVLPPALLPEGDKAAPPVAPLGGEVAPRDPAAGPTAPAAPTRTLMHWQGPESGKVGRPVLLTLTGQVLEGTKGFSIKLKTTRNMVGALQAAATELLGGESGAVNVTTQFQADSGELLLGVLRPEGAVQGVDGGLLTLKLTPKREGELVLQAVEVTPLGRGSDGQAPALLAPISIQVEK